MSELGLMVWRRKRYGTDLVISHHSWIPWAGILVAFLIALATLSFFDSDVWLFAGIFVAYNLWVGWTYDHVQEVRVLPGSESIRVTLASFRKKRRTETPYNEIRTLELHFSGQASTGTRGFSTFRRTWYVVMKPKDLNLPHSTLFESVTEAPAREMWEELKRITGASGEDHT